MIRDHVRALRPNDAIETAVIRGRRRPYPPSFESTALAAALHHGATVPRVECDNSLRDASTTCSEEFDRSGSAVSEHLRKTEKEVTASRSSRRVAVHRGGDRLEFGLPERALDRVRVVRVHLPDFSEDARPHLRFRGEACRVDLVAEGITDGREGLLGEGRGLDALVPSDGQPNLVTEFVDSRCHSGTEECQQAYRFGRY